MMAHEPIPYTLADNPYPVDSTYHRCCNAIGSHAAGCTAADDVRLLAGLRRGVVTLQVDDGSRPFTLSNSEALALAEHLRVLAGEAVAR